MALKLYLKSLEEVSEAMRGEYVEDGEGGFILDVEDKDYKDKLSEFRSNNRNLFRDNEDLQVKLDKLKDIDPGKYAEALEALTKLQELEDQNLLDAGKVDEVVHTRTERMRADFEGQLEAITNNVTSITGERDSLRTKLSSVLIDNAVSTSVGEVAAVRSGAMADILSRAHITWKIDEEGNPVPMNEGKVMYGKDGDKQLTMLEWAGDLVKVAPFLFEGSTGSNSLGGNKNNGNKGAGTIAAGDQDGFNNNLEAIASGKMQVVS